MDIVEKILLVTKNRLNFVTEANLDADGFYGAQEIAMSVLAPRGYWYAAGLLNCYRRPVRKV
jgi:hypothetical protein